MTCLEPLHSLSKLSSCKFLFQIFQSLHVMCVLILLLRQICTAYHPVSSHHKPVKYNITLIEEKMWIYILGRLFIYYVFLFSLFLYFLFLFLLCFHSLFVSLSLWIFNLIVPHLNSLHPPCFHPSRSRRDAENSASEENIRQTAAPFHKVAKKATEIQQLLAELASEYQQLHASAVNLKADVMKVGCGVLHCLVDLMCTVWLFHSQINLSSMYFITRQWWY